ncbi:DUF2971 domain-containing protein [Pseudomonas sp. NPDC087690]|uniref:DUF2971 domain-containing protein n=1 Tax=Pseudomonas sp. NPDC087690 TaxID=3364446 RepID=UPI003827F4AE
MKSIIENKKMWLTDSRFLNDSQEMHDGIERIIHYLNHQQEHFSHRHEYLKLAVGYLAQDLGQGKYYKAERRPVYVCSFSEQRDLLSQWRAYGSYAIEFESDEIPLEIKTCVYDVDEKNTQAAHVALSALEIVASEMSGDGLCGAPSFEAVANLVSLAATFKDSSFSEEREVRLVLGHDKDPMFNQRLKVHFRAKGNYLIPYVEQEIPIKAIKAIHVGPMRDQDLAYTSMSAFVQSQSLSESIYAERKQHCVKVIKSSIPYRAP